MKLAIVGGTGNISSAIVALALERGHDVTVVNRGQRGTPHAGARSIVVDRDDRERFEALMQAERFDAAIDMICFTADDARSSVRAFRGVETFVQTSSVAAYGVDLAWLPATEDHPLRPVTEYGRNKAAADAVFLAAWYGEHFPAVILRPSTTYGPQQGLLRQVAWDFSWIDRVRRGMPIVVCGDGNALHSFLHVRDAAKAFLGVLGNDRAPGSVYNVVPPTATTWARYHRTAMGVIGREVELVGVPFATLERADLPGFDICREIFAHHVVYSDARLRRDVPDFTIEIDLETGMREVLAAMDADGRVPSGDNGWEDALIARERDVRR